MHDYLWDLGNDSTQEPETEVHALLLCEESNMAWFASSLEGRMDVL